MIPADYKEIIKKHLDKVAAKDAVFASKYDSSAKGIEECCKFIYAEAKKSAKSQSMICLADKVVFGWAVHFFDEKEPSKTIQQKEEEFNSRQLSLFDM